MDEVVAQMQADIEIEVFGKESFRISYFGRDPKTVQAVCRRLASIYIEENVSERIRKAGETAEFLGKQTENARAELRQQETLLRDFRQKNLNLLPNTSDSTSQSLELLHAQLESAAADIRALQKNKSILQVQLTETIYDDDPQEAVRKELRRKRRKLTSLRAELTEDHPDIVRLRDEVAHLRSRLDSSPPPRQGVTRVNERVVREIRAINAEIGAKKAEQRKIRARIAEIDGRRAKLPEIELKLDELERDHKRLELVYTSLLSKHQEATRAELMESQNKGEQFKILDPANLPIKASGAGLLKLSFAGLVFGVLLGVGVAFARVLLDTTIYAVEDLTKYADVEILVTIPRFGVPVRQPRGAIDKHGTGRSQGSRMAPERNVSLVPKSADHPPTETS